MIVQGEAGKLAKVLVYVPLDVAKDSQFPFQDSCSVNVWVDPSGGKLIIEPAKAA